MVHNSLHEFNQELESLRGRQLNSNIPGQRESATALGLLPRLWLEGHSENGSIRPARQQQRSPLALF